ncbi:MAG TPA: hypothetical protein VHN18_19225 [Micromonosporaceae bacterium]|nr:hypothetical protein [Micromonosporaceae bacterium]
MRRIVATAALVASTLTVAACGSEPSAGAWVVPSVDVSANNAEVCAATKKLVRGSVTELSESLATLITVKPDDTAAQGRAIATIKKIFTQWATGMREQEGKAADPGLKSGLAESAAGLETAVAQIKTFDDLERAGGALNNPRMEEAGKKMEKVCGPIP